MSKETMLFPRRQLVEFLNSEIRRLESGEDPQSFTMHHSMSIMALLMQTRMEQEGHPWLMGTKEDTRHVCESCFTHLVKMPAEHDLKASYRESIVEDAILETCRDILRKYYDDDPDCCDRVPASKEIAKAVMKVYHGADDMPVIPESHRAKI